MMDQAKSNVTAQNSQKIFCKQPISCPWITSQPYQSTPSKNRTSESTLSKPLPCIPLCMESRSLNEKTCPSLQHSSSQFFYFLRLMQLFPETHPATLHTVLNLCKNDFFCAVDKLLYAKRCKTLYSRSQGMVKRCSSSRIHPYCNAHNVGTRNTVQQEKVRMSEVESGCKEGTSQEKSEDVSKVQILVENNERIVTESKDDSNSPLTVSLDKEFHISKVANICTSVDDTKKPDEVLSLSAAKQDSKR